MAAALRTVDYVVIAEDGAGPEPFLAALAPDRIVRAEAAHQQRCAQLVQHVQQRQAG
jgi:UTP-glucose-1-phosphate uridylyltransferase